MNILFLCVGNSSRSQIAEGIARKLMEGKGTVQSAGTKPKPIHPLAIQVMQEIGIDISKQKLKLASTIHPNTVEYVITLCAEEACPIFLQPTKKIHWPLQDPSAVEGTGAYQLDVFREIRDELVKKIKNFIRELQQ